MILYRTVPKKVIWLQKSLKMRYSLHVIKKKRSKWHLNLKPLYVLCNVCCTNTQDSNLKTLYSRPVKLFISIWNFLLTFSTLISNIASSVKSFLIACKMLRILNSPLSKKYFLKCTSLCSPLCQISLYTSVCSSLFAPDPPILSPFHCS